jgi:elongation factor P
MATTSDLRTNLIIRWNGQLHRVTEFHHHAPGNWRAMVILKLKNIQSGKTIEERVRAGEDIDIVRVDKHNMQFLYREGDSYAFSLPPDAHQTVSAQPGQPQAIS